MRENIPNQITLGPTLAIGFLNALVNLFNFEVAGSPSLTCGFRDLKYDSVVCMLSEFYQYMSRDVERLNNFSVLPQS